MEKLLEEFSFGLFFWQLLLFVGLIFLLRKFAWNAILKAVEDRESNIEGALKAAEDAKAEMAKLQAENEKLLQEARIERDAMLKEARETKNSMISEAKNKAKEEADRIMATAREDINNEKNAAMTELKNQVAALSIEIAEKILKEELSKDDKQKALANQLAEDMNLN